MNKKTIIFTVAIFMMSLSVSAQLGVQLGYNFARIDDLSYAGLDKKNLSGLSGGIFYEQNVVPFVDARMGVLYSAKGAHFTSGDDIYYKIFLNYIEVPLQAKVKVGPLYALGGFYGAYAINGSEKSRIEITPGLVVVSDDDIDFENDEINRFDFGLKLGAGLQYGIGPVNIFAQGEYSIGLQNINANKDEDPLKNKVFSISAGILISLF